MPPCVHHMDTAVGRLVDGLKQRGVLDNTLILFMSDNGGNAESGPNGRSSKATSQAGATRTVFCGAVVGHARKHAVPPLQALQPRRRHRHAAHRPLARRHRAPRTNCAPQPGHLIDIMATCVDVGGANYPAELNGKPILPMEGRSLVPAFANQADRRATPSSGNTKATPRSASATGSSCAPGAIGVGALRPRQRPHRATQPRRSSSRKKRRELAAKWEGLGGTRSRQSPIQGRSEASSPIARPDPLTRLLCLIVSCVATAAASPPGPASASSSIRNRSVHRYLDVITFVATLSAWFSNSDFAR